MPHVAAWTSWRIRSLSAVGTLLNTSRSLFVTYLLALKVTEARRALGLRSESGYTYGYECR